MVNPPGIQRTRHLQSYAEGSTVSVSQLEVAVLVSTMLRNLMDARRALKLMPPYVNADVVRVVKVIGVCVRPLVGLLICSS